MKKKYLPHQPAFLAVAIFIGGTSLLAAIVPPITIEHLLKGAGGIIVGAGSYFLGKWLPYMKLDGDTFTCASLFYRRRVHVSQLVAIKYLPQVPFSRLFVFYDDRGMVKRIDTVSGTFSSLTLGEVIHDLKKANRQIELDDKSRELMRAYEESDANPPRTTPAVGEGTGLS